MGTHDKLCETAGDNRHPVIERISYSITGEMSTKNATKNQTAAFPCPTAAFRPAAALTTITIL
jgi:hypothetical protein